MWIQQPWDQKTEKMWIVSLASNMFMEGEHFIVSFGGLQKEKLYSLLRS